MENTNKPKVLLLTGAGFSTGFLKFGGECLTTKFLTSLITDQSKFEEYFNLLSKDLTDKEGDFNRLSQVRHVCAKVYNVLCQANIQNVNFEHIIYALELICDTTKEQDSKLYRHLEHQISAAVLISEFKINHYDVRALNSFILDVVALFRRDDEVKNERTLCSIKEFKKALNEFDAHHFTLNYDTCFYDLPLLCKTDNPTEFCEDDYLNIKNHHLHGSVLFYIKGAGLAMNRFSDSASYHRKSGLNYVNMDSTKSFFNHQWSPKDQAYWLSSIIGLNKSTKLLNPVYASMWQQFIHKFFETNKLIIIGYSFNDAHINSVLQNAQESLKTIDIVDHKKKGKEQDDFKKMVEKVFIKRKSLLNFHYGGAEQYMNNYKGLHF